MFVIPLPTYLVDFLIALNIALLVFAGVVLATDRILSFSTFRGTNFLSFGIIDQYQSLQIWIEADARNYRHVRAIRYWR